MSDLSTGTLSPRRLLGVILIASSVSLVCGVVVSFVVFRIGGLERERPFRSLYIDRTPGGAWKPISQYMLCASPEWLMEVQSRTVSLNVGRLQSQSASAVKKAKRLDKQATRLRQNGQEAQAEQLSQKADVERKRSTQYQVELQRLVGGPSRNYITRYYNLIGIPLIILWIAVWITAAYIPRQVRFTNQVVKIGALVGLFHGVLLGVLVVLWSLLGGQSLREFYLSGHFYHGQWTGLWLYPVAGVILTGYLFGTLAGWMAKGAERLRCTVFGISME